MSDDDIKALRYALEAIARDPETVPGQWEIDPFDLIPMGFKAVDVQFIAAASPDRIARLLDALKAEQDEVHRLQASHSALYGEVERLRAARVPLTEAQARDIVCKAPLGDDWEASLWIVRETERRHGITGEQE
jgi:hypothetical protein